MSEWMVSSGDPLGPYRILRPIGRGGMGQVFAALHERLNQEVALKLLVPSQDGGSQSAARFIQEARALAQIDHPGVVRIFLCDRLDDGRVYLAMELLEGLSLRSRLSGRSQAVALEEALSIGEQIAAAMASAHRRRIIHRDLKPENIFLCPDPKLPGGQIVKVLDFGIAKVPPMEQGPIVDTQVLTNLPVFMGTAAYVAPEQCRRPAEVTDRADVYALGVVMFEVCAGRPPFVAEERVDLIAMHVREAPPSLHDLAPHVPEQLCAFVGCMLAKDPQDRPTMERCREVFASPWSASNKAPAMPGLSAFTEAQAELFHGRTAEIDELMSRVALLDGEARWLQIEGPSGAGKSSFVHAGLLPRLRERAIEAQIPLRVVVLKPEPDPIRGLSRALCAAFGDDPGEEGRGTLEDRLRSRATGLLDFARERTPAGGRLLLVIDQLEQLFSLGAPERGCFDELIAAAVSSKDSPVRLTTTLRSDFLHRFDRAPLLAAELPGAERYPLHTMRGDALTEAISGVVRRLGMRLADGLVDRMVRDAHSASNPLPLVAHALFAMWSVRSGPVVTHERYEQMGGVTGALSRQAERLLKNLGEQGRSRARRILMELVQVGRGVPDTCRPRSRRDVLHAAGGDDLAEEVLLRLSGGGSVGQSLDADVEESAGMRLVVLFGDPAPEGQRVELLHETLLHAVPLISGWIDEERQILERQADLEALARSWEEAGCPPDGLPTGTLLAHHAAAAGAPRSESERARRFLDSALRLERRSRRIRRAVAATLLLAVIVTGASALFARREQRRAEANLQAIVAATDEIVDDVDWQLGRILHTSQVRRPLLLKSEERVTAAAGQDNPEARRARVHARHRRSDFARAYGTLAEAADLLESAHREIEEALFAAPGDASWTMLLALNESKRGKVALGRGQWEKASELFRRSIEHIERLPGPEDEDRRRTLGTSHAEMGELLLAWGHPDKALRSFDRAVDLLSRNASDYDRGELSLCLSERAEAARMAHDPGRSAADLSRAEEIQTGLVRAHPGNAYWQWILARVLVGGAALRFEQGVFEDARSRCESALTVARALHEGEPVDKSYALLLARALDLAESLARARDDEGEARRAHAERCALVAEHVARDPEDLRFRSPGCP